MVQCLRHRIHFSYHDSMILQLAQQQQAQQPPAGQRQTGQPQQLAIPVGPGGNIDVAAIQNQPQIQHLRQLMQQNPALIQPIIQELATQNPQLTQLFAQNPAALAQIFGVPPEQLDLLEGLADELPQQVIEITPEERAAIQRVRNSLSGTVMRWLTKFGPARGPRFLKTSRDRGILCLRQERRDGRQLPVRVKFRVETCISWIRTSV